MSKNKDKSKTRRDAAFEKKNLNRRNFLMGIGTLPVAGSLGIGMAIKIGNGKNLNGRGKRDLRIDSKTTDVIKNSKTNESDSSLRLGIIGFGFRGEQLVQATKFAHPDWIEKQKKAAKENSNNKVLKGFYEQMDLNITYSSVCDVFDRRIKRGKEICGKGTKGYRNYKELLETDDIDAVIIATPDHWHAQIAIDAANAGKHVYVEKCMTRTAEEAVVMRDAVKKNNIVFQLGHQGRQTDIALKAKELVDKGVLGKITLVETTTNRNNPFAAWIWPIDDRANPKTVDWDLFEGPAPKKVPFSKERFARWRCWWEYGTGMSGDLFTHEYDAVNHILNLGIPHSAVASGGLYYWLDGREVPDIFNATFEFPKQKLSLLYSGSLQNGISRNTLIMGHDATIEMGRALSVWADSQSTKYKDRIEGGIIETSRPIIKYKPGQKDVDAVTSATSKYFADRGLMFTYRNGRRVDTTNLHIHEWLNVIRNGGDTSCNIDRGFEEAITAHMATVSYHEGRRVYWDSIKNKII